MVGAVRGVQGVLVVLHPQQLAFGPSEGAEQGRPPGPAHRVARGVLLVAHEGPPSVLEAHLPVAVVRAREEEVDARGARGVEGVALGPGPVLGVARDDVEMGADQEVAVLGHVDVGHVAHLVSLALEESHELVVEAEQGVRREPHRVVNRAVARHLGQRAVEGDLGAGDAPACC